MRAIRVLVLSLLALAAASALPAAAQEGAVPPPEAAQAVAAEEGSLATAAPMRYTPPRTLRAYWHLFVAFAATWVLLFGYTLTLGARFRRIEAELEAVGRG